MGWGEIIDRREGARNALRRELGFGFLYWLVFLLILEPGNVLRAIAAGGGLAFGEELLRITGASALGAAATPGLLALVRHFPIEGSPRWRNAGILAGAGILAALVLVAISCLLADRLLPAEHRPLFTAMLQESASNGPLVAYCIAGLFIFAHAARFFLQLVESRRSLAGAVPKARAYTLTIPVKSQGRITLLSLERVDWIETQGNYLALHEGEKVHLIRDSLARLESELDPHRFARIHRRIIVALDRVREIAPHGAGDALLKLGDGTELRLSRGFRAKVSERLWR
jgi:hypothetical protein